MTTAKAVVFRDMRPGEEVFLVALVVSVWEKTSMAKLITDRVGKMNGYEWTDNKADEALADISGADVVLVGEADGKLASFATVHYSPKYAMARVAHFAVARECQGRGVGRAMMEALLSRMRRDGMKYARVEAMEHNAPAVSLYKSAGFDELTRQVCLFREL